MTVACKLPNGIWLQLHEMRPMTEPHPMLGTREIGIARKVGEPVLIQGYKGIHHNDEPKDIAIRGGYALTPGVSREFWET